MKVVSPQKRRSYGPRLPIFLIAVFGVPFSLGEWVPFSVEIKGSPEVAVDGTRFTISTEEDAGGTAYFLPQPISLKLKELELQWEWKVENFPKANPTIPLLKPDADFALRVGLILSDGNWRVPLPYRFRKEMMRRGHALSYVLFYTAIPRVDTNVSSGFAFGKADTHRKDAAKPFLISPPKDFMPPNQVPECVKSPFHEAFRNCYISLNVKQKQKVLVLPIQNVQKAFLLNRMELEKLKIVGLWLFADSDNSESRSKAWVENIQFSMPTDTAKSSSKK